MIKLADPAAVHNAWAVSTSNNLEPQGITATFGAEVSGNFDQAGNVLNGVSLEQTLGM